MLLILSNNSLGIYVYPVYDNKKIAYTKSVQAIN